MSASPWWFYGPADRAVLAADEKKCERFVEVTRDCIVPRLRNWCVIWLKIRHLLDISKDLAQKFGQIFAATNADFVGLTSGIAGPFHVLGAFATEHVPILDRWSRGDFSVLQPWISNSSFQVMAATGFMIAETSKAGALRLVSYDRTIEAYYILLHPAILLTHHSYMLNGCVEEQLQGVSSGSQHGHLTKVPNRPTRTTRTKKKKN
jgi:hypothetical protein